jgi:hypothetical protein
VGRAPRRARCPQRGARAPLGRGGDVIVRAHVAGVPVGELIPMAAGVGTALVLARTWISPHLPRHKGSRR